MRSKAAIRDEITTKLLENAGITIFFSDSERVNNSIAKIKNERFIVDVKPEITQGNQNFVLQQLRDVSREENLPVLLVTKYIPSVIAKSYVEAGVNYMDIAGNCNIRQGDILLIITGKKVDRLSKTNQSRAFQEAGIKLIYCLLVNHENTNKSFRELAELSQTALGSVSAILRELDELKFILKTKTKKVLKNKFELLQRWVIAYHDVLRPKLLLKKMSFVDKADYTHWNSLELSTLSEKTLWGGECGASILIHHLTPGKYTIYTDASWQSIGQSFKLFPDENGKVEVLQLFYKATEEVTVSPLLIYADLMGSGDSRNLETAEIILNNELQYLK